MGIRCYKDRGIQQRMLLMEDSRREEGNSMIQKAAETGGAYGDILNCND